MSKINSGEFGNMLIGAYIGEIIDIHTKNTSEMIATTYPTVTENSALTFATTSTFDSSSIKALLPSARNSLPEFQRTHINMSQLAKTTLDLEQLKQFINNFSNTERLEIYGIMINLENGKRLNPLHPLIAQAIVSGNIQLPETFDVIVYPMQKEQKITTAGLEKNVTAVVELVNFLNQNGQTAYENIKPKHSVFTDIQNISKLADPLEYVVEFQSAESTVMNNVITPVQYATDGVITPYYGVVQSVHRSDGYVSHQLSPMLSGNINTTGMSFGNTCTGDLSNKRYANLHVLNGFNMSSAYTLDTVSTASIYWIKACQLVSIELLNAEVEHVKETQEKE